ncbi:MAG TPA: potassium/proton antiporter [Bryobacteraceae bacterium]|nr:potassium/proton antiporter [Bryobacteraceae bacterium]
MNFELPQILLAAGALLLVSIGASRVSARLGIPALLFFLAIGMLAGSDGPGGIWFDNAQLAQAAGSVALAYILFSGGLDTRWAAVRRVLWPGLSLATVGVFMTALFTGAFASHILGLSLTEGMLIGAIVSSTDAAAVFNVLRTQRLVLRKPLGSLLEFESGMNDPMAVLLTVALTQAMAVGDATVGGALWLFARELVLGAVLGFAFGKLGLWLLNSVRLESEGLYPVLVLALVMATFGGTAAVGGSGFLAVYIAGLVLGKDDFVHRRSINRFIDGIAWLMQIAMFLILGLLVFPSRLPAVAFAGTAVAFFLVLVARPAAVFISLAFSELGVRQKLLVSWVGLRGAVPIVLATFPLLAGVKSADLYFHLVFFVVVSSVLIQGPAIPWVARRLGLGSQDIRSRRSGPLEFVPALRSSSELIEVVLKDSSPQRGKRIVDIEWPPASLAVLLTRGDEYVVPRGTTELFSGDELLVLCPKQEVNRLQRLFGNTDA